MDAGYIVYDKHQELVPADQDKYGDKIDNTYLGNLYDMAADYIESLEDTQSSTLK